jgi:hypothetical protein
MEKTQKEGHRTTAISVLTKVPKAILGEKSAYSTNGLRKTGYPHVEECNLIPISHPV